ncbi:MAG: peptidoglycan-binding protein [Novosphingobium sp.]|nr:peptidoglycan-binding protein [Novosphingobium sp.]
MPKIVRLGTQGDDVKKWQSFLVKEGYVLTIDGDFGSQTLAATLDWQEKNQLVIDGLVGPIVWAFVSSLPAKKYPQKLRTSKDILAWIQFHLEPFISISITLSHTQDIKLTKDWLAAIACRETGHLILKYVNRGKTFEEVTKLMKGDYRNGRYNGFGYWQIDVGSYPDFTNSNDWKDPQKTCNKAAEVLIEKAVYLTQKDWKNILSVELFERAVTAAYNCGQKNVDRALRINKGVDYYTFNKDYSADVFYLRTQYKRL